MADATLVHHSPRTYRKPFVRILAASIVVVLAFLLLFSRSTAQFLDKAEHQRRAHLSTMVKMARNSVEPLVAKVRTGQLSKQEGMQQVRDLVRRMTYEDEHGKNYMFMSAYDGTMLVQPYDPNREMTNQWELHDGHGTYIIQALIRSAKSYPDGGFVNYFYHPPGSKDFQEKLAFVMGIPELDCYIGTGAYMEQAQQDQQTILDRAKYVSIALVVLLMIHVVLSLREILSANRALAGEIEERKRAEEALRRSESLRSAILDNIPDFAWMKDAESRYVATNEAYARSRGCTRTELIGKSDFDLWPRETAEVFKTQDAEILRTGQPLHIEEKVVDHAGHTRWYQTTKTSIRDSQGQIIGTVGIARDITEHRLVDQRVRESEEQLRRILEASPLAIGWSNAQGIIEFCNRKFYSLFGYSTEELPNLEQWFLRIYPDPIYREEMKKYWDGLVERARTQNTDIGPGEADVTCKDGTVRRVEILGTLVGDRALVFFEDITERKRTEEALRESEERFREVFAKSADSIVLLDEGRVIDCNDATVRLFGVSSKEDIIEMSPKEVSPERQPCGRLSSEMAQEVIDLACRKGSHQFEWTNRRWDGSEFTVEVRLTAIHLGGRTILHSLSRDITERKRAEEALRQEKGFSEATIDGLPGIFYVFDESGRLLRWNRQFEVVSGVPAEEMLYRLPTDFFETARDKALIQEAFRKCLLEGEALVEADLFTRQGQRIPYLFRGVRARLGDKDHVLGLAVDITDRKRAEEALARNEERFRLLAENSRDIIYRMSLPDGRYEYISPAVTTISGHSPEEFYANPLLIQEIVHPAWRDYVDTQKRNMLVGEVPPTYEFQIVHRSGEVRWVYQRNVLLRDAAGKPVALQGLVTDVTEQKRAEEEQRRRDEQIRHTQKLESLGILAGGIAHDFNNLLMAILGHADLALQDLSPVSPVRENLDAIEKASRRAAELCRQMLAYSGKGRFVVQPIDLGEVVREMAHMLDVSISKKAVLKYNLAPDLPTVEADASQMRQIIMNLIVNASEAIGDKSGVIAVSTGAVRMDREDHSEAWLNEPLPEGLYVCLEVVDTGCGMDEQTRLRIFDPFFTTKFTGRGLGLAAVLGIVRGHKGAIRVSSEPGKGTTFKVLLPASAKPVESLSNDTGRPSSWRGSGTVLLVDDEETVRSLGKVMLERLGFRAMTAGDGHEALELFRNHKDEIVCVILDLTMPRMDGAETFRELRRLRPDVRVIMSSGYNEQEVSQQFVGKGLAGFIQKPYQLKTMAEKIREVLARGPGPDVP